MTAAIIWQDGRVLVARRSYGAHAGKWEFPGGKVEPGESDEQCLARELKEELGIEVAVGPQLAVSIFDYGQGVLELRAYEVTWLGGVIKLADHDRVEWAEPTSLLKFDLLPADIPIARQISGA